jgi:biopolymer transport protein ExbD
MAMLLPGGEDDEEARPVADINVTPLVDVMLVLLVIFMVTAPMLSAGVTVDLPRSAAARLSPPEPPLELGLTREGRLFLFQEGSPNRRWSRAWPRCMPRRRTGRCTSAPTAASNTARCCE